MSTVCGIFRFLFEFRFVVLLLLSAHLERVSGLLYVEFLLFYIRALDLAFICDILETQACVKVYQDNITYLDFISFIKKKNSSFS